MTRIGRGTLMLFLGLAVGRLVLDGRFAAFVQLRMRWPLGIAVLVVIAFGLVDLITGLRESDPGRQRTSVGPRVGWLLAAPILVLFAVAPAALGAAAADRVAPYQPTQTEIDVDLPDVDPLPMRVIDFTRIATWDESGALVGRRVLLEGIVLDDGTVPGGFVLARFLVSCCAADGVPIKVAVHGVDGEFAEDDWVRATVTLRDEQSDRNEPGVVEVDAIEIEIIEDPPASQYETL
ncbi:MAG: TIGR03943 family protein [Actinomycetota bacterium]